MALNIRAVLQRPISCAFSQPKSLISMYEVQQKFPRGKVFERIPMALYGGRHTVTMLPGSGIGPELMSYVKNVSENARAPVDFEIIDVPTLPHNDENDEELGFAITSIKRNGVAIKGNIETQSESSEVLSRNVAIRNALDLYVNVLRCKSYPGSVRGVVESMKVITEMNSERVAKYAFDYAKKLGRKKVTIVHKANIMKLSDGLFLETCRKMSKHYPEIETIDMIIDNCCMQLVSKPSQFDVIVTTNLYGAVVSNVVCGLIGGAGLSSGINYGDQPGTRNTATAIAGTNTANPIAMLNAFVDMLHHLGHQHHSQLIHDAIVKTVTQDLIHTPGDFCVVWGAWPGQYTNNAITLRP